MIMETLLPHFERQLIALRRLSKEFAAKHPKLAGELMLAGDTCGDPHVERLIQATALLNARIARVLDDDYSRFTEALLSALYPHYLRAIPSYSIALIDTTAATGNAINGANILPRGTALKTTAQGTPCQFRTAYDVLIGPVTIAQARFHPTPQAPASVRLPAGSSAQISIEIASTSNKSGLELLPVKTLRVYLDGEPSLRAVARDTLFMRVSAAYVEMGNGQPWLRLPGVPLAPVGFAATDAMLPFRPSEHPAYRLLSEYFAYPEKFNFIDIDLASLLGGRGEPCPRVKLHLILSGVRTDSDTARILAPLSAENLLLGCTPIINLFQTSATPIKLTHTKSEYQLLLDDKPACAFELYSVDSVYSLCRNAEDSEVTEFVPYYSLRHGAAGKGRKNHYYLIHRDEELASSSPGLEYFITFVNGDFDPLAAQSGTVSLDVTLSNRDVPQALPYGLTGGDLQIDSSLGKFPIRFLRKPTPSRRLLAGRNSQWGLISHLALNHRSLSSDGVDSLIALLKLHTMRDSAVGLRQVEGIVGLQQRATTAWVHDAKGAAYLSGIELRLTLDEEAFAGSSIHAFAQLLDHLFGLSVHLNSFTQLVVLSSTSGKELMRCLPRNGDLSLV